MKRTDNKDSTSRGAKPFVQTRACCLWFVVGCTTLVICGAILSGTARGFAKTPFPYNPWSAESDGNVDMWNLQATLQPVNEVDYAGQLMMVAGAFPLVTTVYTFPNQVLQDFVVPASRMIWQWVTWLARLTIGCLEEAKQQFGAALARAVRWADWLFAEYVSPFINAVCNCVGRVLLHTVIRPVLFAIEFAWGIMTIIAVLFRTIARSISIVFGGTA